MKITETTPTPARTFVIEVEENEYRVLRACVAGTSTVRLVQNGMSTYLAEMVGGLWAAMISINRPPDAWEGCGRVE